MFETDQKTILIVDDDENIRYTYAQLFRQNNFVVVEARDGVEGLDIATSKEVVDVIFTGIVMPRMDGFQLMNALKEYSSTADIPIVVNSHLGREEDRKKALETGAKDFIVQGVTAPIDVVRRVAQSIGVGEYLIAIDLGKYDGTKFAEDHKIETDFKCKKCNEEMALRLKYFREGVFKAHVVCPQCESEQEK
ncbi:MAG: response regulator [Patescibacteria group bacterium]|nr:response regulator [Patescibacteria group bacterium]